MKIKSALITQASGSIGGMTASHNSAGMYLRARAIPTDPATTYQMVIRNIVAGLANHWQNTLTAAQRLAWTLYATNVQVLDRLGDLITLSGLAMYVRCNTAAIQAGLARVDDAPTVFDKGEYTYPSFAIDEPNDEVDVTFTNTDDWANEDGAAMLVYGSFPKAPTINYYKGPYRFLGKIDGNSVTPPTSPATFALPAAIATGQRAFLQVVVIRADGRRSDVFRGQADA